MWSHIVDRFHAYYTKVKLSNGRTILRKSKTLDKKRLSGVLKDARKGLKYLQRANDGHIQNLGTVLDMTYARVGKRRRQLIAKLQAPDLLPDDASVAALSAEMSRAPRAKRVPELTDELLALLKSQVKQDSSRFTRAPLRGISPKVPTVNIWQRKFPEKRRVNFIRAWYAKTLDRLMPPLGADEWERLRGLATGEIRSDGPVPRRKTGTTEAGASQDPVYRVALRDLPYRLTSSTERVVEKKQHPETVSRPHELTPRFMRKMWANVFEKCPQLEWNNEWKKWNVTWGNVRKQADLVFDSQKAVPPDVFDGVDRHGQLLVQDMVEPLPPSL
ncbi:MAG: hypothetical protein L6R40_002570 [Gallowayella cf. fulva]|nr:MAG: hypothetical protein L6R40_002570 [Xanthomendoza cf. fulva]